MTNGNYYWVIIAQPAGNSWAGYQATTTNIFYNTTDYYTSPPANMNTGTWSNFNNWAPFSVYVTIQ